MYPLNTEQPYPRNQWWVGATSHEVGRTLFQRTILGEPVVFYRTLGGHPVAMHGLCPHRLFPLAQSKLVGDAIQCGYHGFTFDCSGTCVKIPSQSSVPKGFRTRVFPTVERGEWIWIWTGDPALADAQLIPEPPGIFAQGWETNLGAMYSYRSRYQLLIDNLFDLTHLGFIHASIVGDMNEFVESAAEIVEGPGICSVTREAKNLVWGPFGDFMFGCDGSQFYDTEQTSAYYGPSLVITGGAFRQSAAQSPTHEAREIGIMWFLHAITPETPTSTHYFGGISRNYRLGDGSYSMAQVHNSDAVRQQDVDALSSIELYVDQFASTRHELSAHQDAGAIRVRRLLAQQIKSESDLSTAIGR
jgi:phenylpropionate dioxygenase-like ring-hydroxylating dioxygenase large terminal subunit